MVYENDRLNIPEKYKKMSVSEIRSEKERIYMEIKANTDNKKRETKKEISIFHF